MKNLPTLILSSLVTHEEYTRKCIPFIKEDYFDKTEQEVVFRLIKSYLDQYNTLPPKNALLIDLSNDERAKERYSTQFIEILVETISRIYSVSEQKEYEIEWMIDKTEEWCKERAISNAIIESVSILDKNDKENRTPHAIPKLLEDALSVSFDQYIGHSYTDNFEERYDFYHQEEEKLPFDIDLLNKITNGGLTPKTLSLFLAGCVHPSTMVRIRYDDHIEAEVPISEIKTLLDNGYSVEVDSPDGFVPVNFFVDKGEWDEYILETMDGKQVICNENHLFQTTNGWELAKNLDVCVVFTNDGWKPAHVKKTGKKVPIVDINVNHENHRYYTNGISSHNTGTGKTLAKCHLAASYLMKQKNVLYITMEMAEERIAERIDANLMNVPIQKLKTLDKKIFDDRIANIKQKTTGKLFIKQFPTGNAHVGHFRALLNDLRQKKKFVPDVIFIDYLNICASSRIRGLGGAVNTYSYVKSIAEEVRGLAIETETVIISSTQSNRGAANSSDFGIENISESFGVAATVDLLLGLISTDELAQQNQIMVKQLKNRYNDLQYYNKFVVGVDRSRMRLFDVDDGMGSAAVSVTPTGSGDAVSSSGDFSGFEV